VLARSILLHLVYDVPPRLRCPTDGGLHQRGHPRVHAKPTRRSGRAAIGPGCSVRAKPNELETRIVKLLVVIALFSSQFELKNGRTGVKLSMDLAGIEGRLRDGCGTAKRWSARRLRGR